MRDLENADPGTRFRARKTRRPMIASLFLAMMALLLFAAQVSAGDGNNGMTQLSGSGVFDVNGECTDFVVDPESDLGVGPHFAIVLNEGDLQGCMYIIVDSWSCTPGDTYREYGREIYVIDGPEWSGTFQTTYFGQIKWNSCDPDGVPDGIEIFGFCQHPLVLGEYTDGAFEGVTGKLKFKDDVTDPFNPIFNMTGHMQGLP